MLIAERQRDWLEQGQRSSISPVMRFAEDRLELGAGTVLARFVNDPRLGRILDLNGRESRVVALLAAAYRRPISVGVLDHIRRGAREWVRGEPCLAQIHLALTGLPRLEAPEEAAYRLFIAEGLIDGGIPPRDILRALDLDPAPIDRLEKAYNEAESRVPKGNGRPSGQWTAGGETTVGALGTAIAIPSGSLFETELSVVAYRALLAFASTFVEPAVALGLAIIPTEAGTSTVSGTFAGRPDLSYQWNNDEGHLVLLTDIGGSRAMVGEASLGPDSQHLYSDENKPIGRVIGDHIVIDIDAAISQSRAVKGLSAEERARANEFLNTLPSVDQPKLCPEPAFDIPHGASDRAKSYQERITGLPPGLAVWLNGVSFDGCREEDGTMLEAKGPGYATFLDSNGNWYGWYKKRLDLEAQLKRQSIAAGNRRVEWHVAEKEAADTIRQMAKDLNLSNINVIWDPLTQEQP